MERMEGIFHISHYNFNLFLTFFLIFFFLLLFIYNLYYFILFLLSKILFHGRLGYGGEEIEGVWSPPDEAIVFPTATPTESPSTGIYCYAI